MLYIYIITFLVAFGATYLSLVILLQVAHKYHWFDIPDGDRKVHTEPIPRIGGMGMVVGIGCGLGISWMICSLLGISLESIEMPSVYVIVGAFILILTGIYDDIWHLGFKIKLFTQTLTAIFVIYTGYRWLLEPVILFGVDISYWLSISMSFFWVVGVVNSYNLIDGLDGLAGGIGLISFVSLTIIYWIDGNVPHAVLVVVMVAALGAFILQNFHPAKLFMGDTGSLLIGFTLAIYSLPAVTRFGLEWGMSISILVFGLPILDTFTSVGRRLVAQNSIFEADKEHIHHRVYKLWGEKNQTKTVFILYLFASFMALGGIIISFGETWLKVIVLIVESIAVLLFLIKLGYFTTLKRFFGFSTEPHPILNQDQNTSLLPTNGSTESIILNE